MQHRTKPNMTTLVRAVVAGILFYVLSALLFVAVNSYFEKRLGEIRTGVIATLSQVAGRSVSWDSMSPGFFRTLEVRGLRLKDDAGATLLHIRNLEITIDILALFGGNAERLVSEIAIRNTLVEIDTRRDMDVMRKLENLFQNPSELPEMNIRTEHCTVRLNDGQNQFEVAGLQMLMTPDGSQGFELDLAAVFSFSVRQANGNRLSSRVALTASGRTNKLVNEAALVLGIGELRLPGIRIGAQTFSVLFEKNRLRLEKIQDSLPLELVALFDLNSLSGDLSFRLEAFQPSSIITLQNSDEGLNTLLATALTGKGEASFNLSAGTFGYDLNLSAVPAQSLFGVPVEIRANLVGSEKNLSSVDIQAGSDVIGQARFSGSVDFAGFLPNGQLIFDDFLPVRGLPLAGSVLFERTDGDTISFRSDQLMVSRLALACLGRLGWDGHDWRFGLALTEKDRSGTVRGAGIFSSKGAAAFDGVAEGISLHTISEALPETLTVDAAQFSENSAPVFQAVVSFQVSADGFLLNVPVLSAKDSLDPANHFTADLTVSNAGLKFNMIEYDWSRISARGMLQTRTNPQNEEQTLTWETVILGTQYQGEGIYVPGKRLDLRGNYGLELAVTWDEGGTTSGYAQFDKLPLPFLGRDTALSGLVNLSLRGDEGWNLTLTDVELKNIYLTKFNPATISLSAMVGPQGLMLQYFRYQDKVSDLGGYGRADIHGGLRNAEATLELSDEQGESLVVALRSQEGALSGTMELRESPLERFLEKSGSGTVTILARIAGTITDPRLEGTCKLEQLEIDGDVLRAQTGFLVSNHFASATDLQVFWKGYSISGGQLRIDAVNGLLEMAGSVGPGLLALPGETLQMNARWSVDPQLDISLLLRELEREGKGRLDLDLPASWIAGQGTVALPKRWSFEGLYGGNAFALSGGPGKCIEIRLTSTGEVTARVAAPLPAKAVLQGSVGQAGLDLRVKGLEISLLPYKAVLAKAGIQLSQGQVSGELEVKGNLLDPLVGGTLVLAMGKTALPVLSDGLDAFQIRALLKDNRLTLQPTTLQSGTARFTLKGSSVLDHFALKSWDIALDTLTEQGIRGKAVFSMLVVAANVRGSITVKGGADLVQVRGAITVAQCRLTLSTETLPQSAESAIGLDLILKIASSRNVEFWFPNDTVPIIKANIDTGQSVLLTINSLQDSFQLEGDVRLRGGQIFYFQQSFIIREGSIGFKENERSFDPRITVRAELRTRVPEHGTVKIILVTSQTKLSQFSPRFETDSQLSNREILALLGQSIIARAADQTYDVSSALMLTGDLVSHFGIVKELENTVRSTLNLDMVTFRTYLFQNLIEEAALRGTNPLDNSVPSLGKYLDKTSIVFGKYLSDALFLQLLVQLGADTSLSREARSFGGLTVESEVILEWKTPLFMLEWSFSPRNADQLFVMDNTLTFSWNLKF